MTSIDDERLMAYADDELDDKARAEVESAAAADPAIAARIEAHRALRRRVSAGFASVLDDPVPDRLSRMLRPPAEIVDLAESRSRKEASAARPWRQWAAMAATLVVGVLAGRLVDVGSPAIVAEGSGLAARGELAVALDTELAGGRGGIGLSFKNRAGEYCRTFRAEDLAGLACRKPGGWSVQMAMAAPSKAAGDYRMANSDMPREVVGMAEAMIEGEPLDAAAEAAVRARGWRD